MPQAELDDVPRREFANEKAVAVRIRGESLGAPLDGWLTTTCELRSLNISLASCAWRAGAMADSSSSRFRSAAIGRFDLISTTGKKQESLYGIQVERAAAVRSLSNTAH